MADSLDDIEKKIAKIYKQAEKETNEKLKKYMADFKQKDTIKKALLKKGEISKAEYDQWRIGQLMIGKRWEDMRDTLAGDFTNKNAIARSIAVSHMPEAYAISHNYSTFLIEQGSKLDTGYALYNRATVERLIRDDPDLLPPPGKTMQTKIALGEAKKWQKSKVQSVFAQALLQGESIDKTAKRIANSLSVQNMNSSVRYARTALTGAQNAGNVDAYKRARSMGIKTKKMWVATLDGRTRHDHRMLDGQTRDLEDPFKNDLGEIMFPGDPTANPANIWNCRCTIIPQIEGFEKNIEDLGLRYDERLEGMSYDEWKNSKKRRKKEQDYVEPEVIKLPKHVEPDAIRLPTTLFKDKQAKALEDYLSGVEGKDPDVAELYGKIGDLAESKKYSMKVSYTEKQHQVETYVNRATREISDVVVKIPKMEGNLADSAETTIHELGHFIDLLHGNNNYYSAFNSKLKDAIKNGNPMSESTTALFKRLKDNGDKAYKLAMESVKARNTEYNNRISELWKNHEWSAIKQLQKERDKAWKEGTANAYDAVREAHEGYGGLEDIYDAIMGGKLYDNGYFGHGSRYYSSESNKAAETFANYCAMSQACPEAFEILKKEQPGIYEACRDMVKEILGR